MQPDSDQPDSNQLGSNSEVTQQNQPAIASSGSPVPPKPRAKFLRRLVPLVVLLVFINVGGALWWNQDILLDWAKLRNYQPATEVAQLSSETTMTTYGQRLFYVNMPAVEERDTFNSHCNDTSEQEAAVLGCFVGDRRGIYLYDVVDERLKGIKEVTAAHEMLHQAYARLNTKDRTKVNAWLLAYAATITDQRLKDKLALYQKTEPTEMANEMHSIFATEVAALPPSLEAYYKQYFKDRHKVIAFHAQYQAAFDERITQIADYDKQLADIRPQIDSGKEDLDAREKSLRQQRAQLDAYLAHDEIESYNAAVPPYNSQVGAYRQAVTATNELINRYNALIDARNIIAVQEKELLQAQDSQAP